MAVLLAELIKLKQQVDIFTNVDSQGVNIPATAKESTSFGQRLFLCPSRWPRTHRGGGDREQTSFTWEELIRLKAGGSTARILPGLQPVTVAGLNSCATWASFSPNRLSNLAEEIGYEDGRAVSHCVYSSSSSGDRRRSSSGSAEEEKKEGRTEQWQQQYSSSVTAATAVVVRDAAEV